MITSDGEILSEGQPSSTPQRKVATHVNILIGEPASAGPCLPSPPSPTRWGSTSMEAHRENSINPSTRSAVPEWQKNRLETLSASPWRTQMCELAARSRNPA